MIYRWPPAVQPSVAVRIQLDATASDEPAGAVAAPVDADTAAFPAPGECFRRPAQPVIWNLAAPAAGAYAPQPSCPSRPPQTPRHESGIQTVVDHCPAAGADFGRHVRPGRRRITRKRPGVGATAGQTFRRISSWLVAVEGLLAVMAPLLMVSSLLFAAVWAPRKLMGRMRGIGCLSVRAWPLLATLPVAGLVALAVVRGEVFNDLVAWVAPSSPKFFWLVAVMGGFAVMGVVQALRLRRKRIHRVVWWHSFATSVAIAIVSLYFGYWGIFGLRTWA